MVQKVRMSILVRDRQYLRDGDKPGGSEVLLATPLEWVEVQSSEDFYDGPVTKRIAVLDFDAENGGLRPGAKFLAQGVGKTVSCYDVKIPDMDDSDALLEAFESDAFIQVNTFATVMKTIQFFESPDALGRQVTWAFDSPQLLVVPRAGRLANAFYQRESSSLQFFYCPSPAGHTVYTSLSHDIIVHETTHAILDGVAPDLYHATRVQSLALHEAVADLAAIVLTLLNDMVVFSLDMISGGKLDIRSELAKFAVEFGRDFAHDRLPGIPKDFLRVLDNQRTLDPDSTDLADPYEVSLVMSGAIYQAFVNRARSWGSEDLTPERIGEKEIRRVRGNISRMVFRALDYLPPGEASLADFGRAMVAAHEAVYAGRRMEQRLLVRELVERKVVKEESELRVDKDVVGRELPGVNSQDLLDDHEAAERFVERNRGLLRIPARAEIRVEPRRVRIRVPRRSRKHKPKQDLVLRVTWEAEEEHDVGFGFASRWMHSVGTTLVLDWDTRRILSVLTTDQGENAHADRDRTLRRWLKMGLLRAAEDAMGPDGQPRSDTIVARKAGKAMRVAGSVGILCT